MGGNIYYGRQFVFHGLSKPVGYDEQVDVRRKGVQQQTFKHIRHYIFRGVYARPDRVSTYVGQRRIVRVKIILNYNYIGGNSQ